MCRCGCRCGYGCGVGRRKVATLGVAALLLPPAVLELSTKLAGPLDELGVGLVALSLLHPLKAVNDLSLELSLLRKLLRQASGVLMSVQGCTGGFYFILFYFLYENTTCMIQRDKWGEGKQLVGRRMDAKTSRAGRSGLMYPRVVQ